MAYSKIIFNNDTWMDISNVTVTSDTLKEGVTATKNDGTKTIGSIIAPSGAINLSYNGTYKIADYAFADVSVLDNIQVSKLLARETYGNYYNSEITNLRSYAFYHTDALETVELPNVETAGESCFDLCRTVSEIRLPKLQYVPKAFAASCFELRSIDFPNASYIGELAFIWCSKLTFANLPNASFIARGAFSSCVSLAIIDIPMVESIESYCFNNCSTLSILSLPKLITLVSNNTFTGCKNLHTVIFSSLSNLSINYLFSGLSNMRSLYLLNSSVCTLSDRYVLAGSPFSSSVSGVYGSVFVPESLYSAYSVETNWATYNNRLVSLTDSDIEALAGG